MADPLGPNPFEFLNYKRGAGFQGRGGWKLDWQGGTATHRQVEAARLGIDEVTKIAVEMAKDDHPWFNRSGQTEESVFQRKAHYNVARQQVWGSWGVRDLPREPPREAGKGEYARPLTTKDVALFLEFGTVNMAKRPWLYPVWDETKYLLPVAIKLNYDALPSNFRYSIPGRFLSFTDVFGPGG